MLRTGHELDDATIRARYETLPGRTGLGQQRLQDRHAGLHRIGRHQHFRDEQDPVAEVDADDAHPLDQRVVEDPIRAPAAPEEDVGSLGDRVGHAVVEVVVHLLRQVFV